MFAENFQYEKAVASFEKAFVYEAGDEFALSAYAFALYELRTIARQRMFVSNYFQWVRHFM